MTIDRFLLVKAIDEQRQVVRNRNTRGNRLLVLKGENSGKLSEAERQEFIDKVRTVKHSYFVRVHDAFEDDSRICVAETYLIGGTLKQMIDGEKPTLPEKHVLDVLAQVAMALRYLHSDRNLVHCAVSPENVLIVKQPSDDVDNGHMQVKLGSIALRSATYSLPPSPISPEACYMAPELWPKEQVPNEDGSIVEVEKNVAPTFTPFTDMWALGCLAHRLCTGMDLPFAPMEETFGRLADLICNSDPLPIDSEKYSEGLRGLVGRLLSKRPEDRPSADRLCEEFLIAPTVEYLLTPNINYKDLRTPEYQRSGVPSPLMEAEEESIERPVSSFSSKLSITDKFITEEEVPATTSPAAEAPPEPVKAVPIKPAVRGAVRGRGVLGRGRGAPPTLGKGPSKPAPPKPPAYKKGDIAAALEKGQIPRLREIFKYSGVNLEETFDYPDGSGHSGTALHQVAESGRVDLAACLIEAGANLEACNSNGETPLYRACISCQLGMLQLLNERGAKVNVFVESADEMATPLQAAVTCGHIAVVRYLLRVANAEFDTKNSHGHTALHIAAKYGDADSANELINSGADINSQDKANHATPLHRAAAYDRVDLAKLLIRNGAKVEAKTKQGKTPLHWAAEKDNDCMTLLLVGRGASVDARVKPDSASHGETALHIAASKGHLRTLRVLLEHSADVDALDNAGRTPLLWAALHGEFEVSRALINKGANVKVVSSSEDHECSALHLASASGNAQLVELLLGKGASPEAQTTLGRTAAHWACERGNTETLRLLLMREPKLVRLADDEAEATPLFDACWFGHVPEARLLVDHGANVNEKSGLNLTPLHAASEGGDVATIKFLLEKGAKINSTDVDKETPLHRAIVFGQCGSVKALVEAGASQRAKTSSGLTPLQLAKKEADGGKVNPEVAAQIVAFLDTEKVAETKSMESQPVQSISEGSLPDSNPENSI